MGEWKKSLKEWFGYDRRERVATSVLLLLVSVMLMVRYLLPERSPDIEISMISTEVLPADTIVTANSGKVATVRPVSRVMAVEIPVINLNMCDSSDLERLPGIGRVLSSRIIRYGNLLGGYADIRQLHEVYGLQPAVIERISGMVKADTSVLRKLNVNEDTYPVYSGILI
jgi:hypothetical protein